MIDEVDQTRELERIRLLPSRRWTEDYDLDGLVQFMTENLRTHRGTMSLWPHQAVALAELHDFGCWYLPLDMGEGKAICDSEPVLHERGWVPIGDVKPGDRVYGSDGRLHGVLGVYPQGERDVYRITFSDRTTALCDLDHLWTLRDNFTLGPQRKGQNRGVQTVTVRLRDIMDKPLYRVAGKGKNARGAWRYFLPMSEPVQYPEQDLPLDPYTLGALIGDGGMSQSTINFTSMDADIVQGLALPEGVSPKVTKNPRCGRATQYNLTTRRAGPRGNPLATILRGLGLMGHTSHTKFIPRIYLTGSVPQRIALLQGLLDTDGESVQAAAAYSTISPQLATDFQELVEGLGGSATYQKRHNHIRISVRLPASIEPFRCKRKLGPWQKASKGRQRPPGRSIRSIDYSHRESCTCIAVDTPDHLFHLRHNILTHNTLLSLLAPVVANSKRPLILVPAALKAKTEADIQVLSEHWNLPPAINILSYETLGVSQGYLEAGAFDCIVADEVDALKDTSTSRWKKLNRYVRDARKAGLGVKFLPMSGTTVGRHLSWFWHIMRLAMGDLAPVPAKWPEMTEWAGALDAKIKWGSFRKDPGALLRLGEYDPRASLPDRGRQAFGDRLSRTPGIVVVQRDELNIRTQIRAEILDLPDDRQELFQKLRDEWRTPDDQPFERPVDLWRHARSLACDLYMVWAEPAPEEWLARRTEWGQYLRESLARSQTLDSPSELSRAIDKGEYPDPLGILAAWREIKDTFRPKTVPVWVGDYALNRAAEWLEREQGVCWVEHIAFGERLEKLTGIPMFGNYGKNKDGILIDQWKGPAIARQKTCHKGFNLQYQHHKNLIVSMTPTGEIHDQAIARTVRTGQTRDVQVDYFFGCVEQLAGFWQAHADVKNKEQMGKSNTRLLSAEIDVPEVGDPSLQGWAWARK